MSAPGNKPVNVVIECVNIDVSKEGSKSLWKEEDWDVNKVRKAKESDEYWDLRRRFLYKNKGYCPKMYLNALSHHYANNKLGGNLYPKWIMDLMERLSVGVFDEYCRARYIRARLLYAFFKEDDNGCLDSEYGQAY